MAQFRPRGGARTPLFDRLVDADPRDGAVEARPERILEGPDLHASIRLDVARLFNTQRGFHRSGSRRPETVLDYGIPDLVSRSLKRSEDHRLLCVDLADALRAFEPRLADPEVVLLEVDARGMGMTVEVRGLLRVGEIGEPLAFPVTIRDLHGREDS